MTLQIPDANHLYSSVAASSTIVPIAVLENAGALSAGVIPHAVTPNELLRYSPEYGPLSFAADPANDRFILARQYAELKQNTGNGPGSLIEYKVTKIPANPPFNPSDSYTVALSNLNTLHQGEGKRVEKPTAMAFSTDGTKLYLADNSRIWELDATDMFSVTKVLSSTNSISLDQNGDYIGTGPLLQTRITSMVVDPELPLIYVANGRGGIVAINTSTGDRFTIVGN